MNRRTVYLVSFCVSICASLLTPWKTASAQSLSLVDVPLEALHDGQSIKLQGLISSQTLNIPIPQSWLPGEDNWIEIQMMASPLLDAARSSITVSLNDNVLASDRLTGIAPTKQRIRIPASALLKGNNTLGFTGTLYLPDDPNTDCQNWDDPSRWMVIAPGGVIHLSFTRENTSFDLASFPKGFVEPLESYLSPGARKQTLFVLPEDPSADDLSSVSAISYALGNHAGAGGNWHPEFTTANQFNDRKAFNRNVIFIGGVPGPLQSGADADKDYIGWFSSPWGVGNSVMVIRDHDRQDGFTPASIFSHPTRSLLLQGNLAYVQPEPLQEPQPFLNDFTFEDLGYLDRTVKGIGQQDLMYRLYIPYDIEPVQVKMHLGLVHSAALDLYNSSFTIYLNGVSIAGFLPSTENATAGLAAIGLPARRLKPGLNFIRISFDLHMPRGSCELAPDTVWATLLNTSRFEVSFRRHTPTPSLKDFPLPFSDPPGSLLVIPEQFKPNDLAHISQLSFLMGSFAGPVQDPPDVVTANAFLARKPQHRNIILIGLPSQNPVTLETNDVLPQPFSQDGRSLREGYGIQLPSPDKEASLGLLQILPSPWVKGGTILVLTGNDPKGLEWTWNNILDPRVRDRFAGTVILMGSANRSQISGLVAEPSLQTLFQQIADASNLPIVGPLLQNYGQGLIGFAIAAIGGALILFLMAWWLLKVIRRRTASALVRKEELEEHE